MKAAGLQRMRLPPANWCALSDPNRELTAWHLAEELNRPFGSKNFLVPKIAVFCPDVRLKHIDRFTETMFKVAEAAATSSFDLLKRGALS
jgi:hypothetical protein